MRYYVMPAMITAAGILLGIALQPLITLIWPTIDSVAIGGLRASSYIPIIGFIVFRSTAGYWLRRLGTNKVSLWAIQVAPALWLSLMIVVLLRSPGHLAVNQSSVYILLSGLLPVFSTLVGWAVGAPPRKVDPMR